MDTQTLTHMANRIGQFYAAQPDRAEALAGIAQHIEKFWAPRMRRQFATHLAAGGEGVHPLVRQALGGAEGEKKPAC
jgi:formate dehydrogenase subunit delta